MAFDLAFYLALPKDLVWMKASDSAFDLEFQIQTKELLMDLE